MKIIPLLILLLLNISYIHGQEPEVPHDYSLDKESDFMNHWGDVLGLIDWLTTTHPAEDPHKRQEAYRFVLEWISQAPDFHVQVYPYILEDVMNEEGFIFQPELPAMYMIGKAKFLMETGSSATEFDAEMAAVIAMIDFYAMVRSRRDRSDVMENLIRINREGSLEEYIADKMKHDR